MISRVISERLLAFSDGIVVSCGYYFNSFGGKGAPGSIVVDGGTVKGTASFGAAVYAHGANDPHVTFSKVTFDHVAIQPGSFDPKLNFSNGPLAIAALGNKLGGHDLGGVTFKDCVVKDDMDRPVLVVVGSEGDMIADVGGRITVHNPHHGAGCSVVAGAEGWSKDQAAKATAALGANVSVDCQSHRVLQSAAAADPSCSDVAARTAAVNAICCDEATEDCSSGQPANCNLGCARELLPFFDDCTALASLAGKFDAVAALCKQALEAEEETPVHCLIRGDDLAYEMFVCSPDSPAYTDDGFAVLVTGHLPIVVAGCTTPEWKRARTRLCDNSRMGDIGTCVGLLAGSLASTCGYPKTCGDPKTTCPIDGQAPPPDRPIPAHATMAENQAADRMPADGSWAVGPLSEYAIPEMFSKNRSCTAAIEGSFDWKMSYAAKQGCKPVGGPLIPPDATGDPTTNIIQGMYCPAAMQAGEPPRVDASAGELTGQRSWGDCYIPQTNVDGGHATEGMSR